MNQNDYYNYEDLGDWNDTRRGLFQDYQQPSFNDKTNNIISK